MNLSESNIRIIEYLAAGKVYKEIAAEMGLKERTIKARIKKMKQCYNCLTASQLAVKVLESMH